MRCELNNSSGRARSDWFSMWSRKDRKDGSHHYEKDKRETERNNEKIEASEIKTEKTDEQFAFVLVRKRRAAAECVWKSRERRLDKMKRARSGASHAVSNAVCCEL